MTKQEKDVIILLMQDRRWELVMKALQEYKAENLSTASLKRDTEFETMWSCASIEGGRFHLTNFFNSLHDE